LVGNLALLPKGSFEAEEGVEGEAVGAGVPGFEQGGTDSFESVFAENEALDLLEVDL
jgi:hypothetical protein